LAGVAVTAERAAAQSAVFVNPGFEEVMPWSGSGEPLGWHNISNPNGALRRTVGDGRGTGPVTPHTGDACIELWYNQSVGQGQGGFVGFTTDTLNFNDPNLWFFDPAWSWEGGGAQFGGWYMIPGSQATNDIAGIKVDLKLSRPDGNPSNQTAWSWEQAPITGTTDGEWRYFEFKLSRAAIRQGAFTGEANGFYTMPPYPHRFKIVVFRFAPDNTPTTGTIFWDDMAYQQYCASDYNMDGTIDFFDYLDFASDFAGEGENADFNGDAQIDFFDYLDFAQAFGEEACT
jgi:hypothetical protein